VAVLWGWRLACLRRVGGLFKLFVSLEGGVRRVVVWLRDVVKALLWDVERTRGGLYI